MKYFIILILGILLSVNLVAQIDEQQIKKQITALEDSIKVMVEQYGEKNEEVVNAYFSLVDILYKQAKYDEALKISEKCLNICLEIVGEKHPLTATAYSNLGIVYYYYTRDHSKVMECFQKALAIRLYLFGEQDSISANLYHNAGIIYFRTGDYAKALESHQKALIISRKILGETHYSTVKSFNNLSLVYKKIVDYTKVLENYQKSLAIQLEILGEKHPSKAGSFSNIGLVYEKKGDFLKALEKFQKTLAIRLEILDEKHSNATASFNSVGLVYRNRSNYNKALEKFQKSLTIQLEILGEKHPFAAGSFNNIDLIYEKKGDYTNALENYQKSLAIQLEILGEKHSNTTDSLNNIGIIYNYTCDYALNYYRKALAICLETLGEKHTKTTNSLTNISFVFSDQSDYARALKNFQKALAIEIKILGKKHPSTANSFSNIALIYWKTRDYINVLKNVQKTLAIELEILGKKHLNTAASLNNIGIIYRYMGDFAKALKNVKKSLAIELVILGEKHPNIIKSQENLAITFETLTYFKQADSLWNIIIPNMEDHLSKNYLYLTDDKKILYLKTIEKTLTSFYNFISTHGSERSKLLAANLIINTKSQILDYAISTRQLIENFNDENLDSIAVKLNIINKKVAQAELLSKDELVEKGWSLNTLRTEQDDLVTQILEHPELKAKLNPAKFSWQQIQGNLKEGEVLIDYFTFYDKVDSAWVFQAMLLKKNEPRPIFIPLSLTKPVVDLLKTKDRLPIYLQYKEARQEMYTHIWKALEPNLKNIKTIHLVPVASLNKIDFGSLQNEGGQYIADIYDFHYYTSSKDFYKQNSGKQIYKDANLYGHIAYYNDDTQQYEAKEDSFELRLLRDTLVALPATLPEVKAIEEICSKHKVSPTLLTINEAKEDTIEYFSDNRAPSIMHFATHGAYLPPLLKKEENIEMASLSGQDRFRAADNPLQRSMLMLSNAGDTWKGSGPNIVTENDGILTALEVTNLDLSNTELVVLSACNSGIGSQHTTEGVFGLPRAFKLAGVDKILVSLWPVEDETTKELMILFYTNLLQHQQNAATALRNAKAEMRKRDDRPKKWAGFVLVE